MGRSERKMDEQLMENPIFGIVFYIIVMVTIFAIPSVIGFVSMYSIRRWLKKFKISILAWVLILHSPLIWIIINDFAKRAMLNAWNTYNAYTWKDTLTYSSIALPFTITIAILGIVMVNKLFPREATCREPKTTMP
jgi:hypothetical protein